MNCKKCNNHIGNNFKFCNKCGEAVANEDVVSVNKPKEIKNVDFFIVPTGRLVLFSILSFGFYSVYWFSHNFSAIKERRALRGKETRSGIWALLNTLTSELLFNELDLMLKESRGKGLGVSTGLLGVLYFVAMLAGGRLLLTPFVFIITATLFQRALKKYQYIGLFNYKEAKFQWKELVFVILGFLFVVGSIVNTVMNSNYDTSYNASTSLEQEAGLKASTMQDISAELNKKLPTMVDADTRLDSTYGIGNSLTYKYTFINLSKSDFSGISLNQESGPRIINSVCTSPEMAFFVQNKSVIRYSYYDKDGIFVETISVDTETDCT